MNPQSLNFKGSTQPEVFVSTVEAMAHEHRRCQVCTSPAELAAGFQMSHRAVSEIQGGQAGLSQLEREVLEACQEATRRAKEMLPLLAGALGVPEDQVFYTWGLRRCAQRGKLEATDWHYFFHGLECDLWNESDGRFLRIDFGPRGTVDTLTSWGVLQFIMTSRAPWREFEGLKRRFAASGPPFDQLSGDSQQIAPVWDRLESLGAFEVVDPRLIELETRSTSVGKDGLRYVEYPPGTSPELRTDCWVAHRRRLSAWGRIPTP